MCQFGEKGQDEFDTRYRRNIAALQSHCHFPMESIFGQDEPEEELRTERERELLQQAMAKANAVARSIYIYILFLWASGGLCPGYK